MKNLILDSKELLTTAEVKRVSESIINSLQEGEGDALHVQVFLTAVEKVSKAVKEGIRDLCVSEIESRSDDGKSLSMNGAKIEVAETGVKYDYSVIPSWAGLQTQIDELRAVQKEIENKAKWASERSPYIDIDTQTGEQTEIVGIPRSSTTAVKVTIGKGK